MAARLDSFQSNLRYDSVELNCEGDGSKFSINLHHMSAMHFKEVRRVAPRDRLNSDVGVNRHIHLLTSGGEDEGVLALSECRNSAICSQSILAVIAFPVAPSIAIRRTFSFVIDC